MTQDILQISWHRCWRSLQARGDGLHLMQKLVAAYEQPWRTYHTLQHLGECLALLAQNLDLAVEPGEVEIALWFHDAVYDTRASDNEAMSAAWAAAELAQTGISAGRIESIATHILATRHAVLPQGQDQTLLIDIDLAILGAPRPRFMQYEAQVRAEYGWVPEGIFRLKRSALLNGLLSRARIYNTPRLYEMFELQARDNLAFSLEMLRDT